jgi:glutathione S-transferase
MAETLTFYHMPHTRSSVALALMHELDVPFELKVLNRKRGENHAPDYLAINPLGKVPALTHGTTVVTEQVAIFLYLADRFALGRLAPALDDPDRGPYLRFLVYYAASFEPAVVDRAMKHETPASMAPYGNFDSMLAVVTDRLRAGPYLLGERFSAADLLWGASLQWSTGFGLVPKLPEIEAYVARITARPSLVAVAARDAALAAEQAAE